MFFQGSTHGSKDGNFGGSNSRPRGQISGEEMWNSFIQNPDLNSRPRGEISCEEIWNSPVQNRDLNSRPRGEEISGEEICNCPAQNQNLNSPSFDDIEEDAIICILSFLSPREMSACCCLNKRFRRLCADDSKVWLAMCERRWGGNINVRKWGNGRIRFRFLYGILKKWENLVGFWRGVGHGGNGPLIVFDWGAYCIIGSRIMAVRAGSYEVCKVPFLWVGVSQEGKCLAFIDPDWHSDSAICRSSGAPASVCNYVDDIGVGSIFTRDGDDANGSDFCAFFEEGMGLDRNKNPFQYSDVKWDGGDLCPAGLVSVNLSFYGDYHLVVEESPVKRLLIEAGLSFGRRNSCSDFSWKKNRGLDCFVGCDTFQTGSLPDNLRSDIYQFFANKISPSGKRAARQRRREEERAASRGRRKCEAEHFVKVVNCSPTPACPLQGLWKGICDSMGLDFILVSYDKNGGIVCRKVGERLAARSGCGSMYWTANCAEFTAFPPSAEEGELYNCRTHIRQLYPTQTGSTGPTVYEDEEVTHVLSINPTSDVPTHNFGVSNSISNMEGRLWQYASGKFGFGFLHNNSIVDYTHIGSSGRLLDIVD